MQLFCDNLYLVLIWNYRPQNLSLRFSQGYQPKGYQTQRSTQQPDFPSHYIIALMEGVCVGGEEDKFRPPAKSRWSIKSRLIHQEESKDRESGCCSPAMRTLGHEWGDQGSSWATAVLPLKLLFGPSSYWQRKMRNKRIYLTCQNGLLLQCNDKTCR